MKVSLTELKELFSTNYTNGREAPPMDIGNCYFIRTLTYHQVGRVSEIRGNFIVLEESSWVADSGRFQNAIEEGTLSEVEPVGLCLVNITNIVDVFPWKHELPKEQK